MSRHLSPAQSHLRWTSSSPFWPVIFSPMPWGLSAWATFVRSRTKTMGFTLAPQTGERHNEVDSNRQARSLPSSGPESIPPGFAPGFFLPNALKRQCRLGFRCWFSHEMKRPATFNVVSRLQWHRLPATFNAPKGNPRTLSSRGSCCCVASVVSQAILQMGSPHTFPTVQVVKLL